MRKVIFTLIALLPMLVSCKDDAIPLDNVTNAGKEEEESGGDPPDDPGEDTPVTAETLIFSMEDFLGERAELQGSISLFSGETNQKITVEASGFSGEIASADQYYALYPYNESASMEDGVLHTVLPNCQKGVRGSFDPSALFAVGASKNGTFPMKNVPALLKVHIGSDVTSLTVANQDGSGLAGKVDITLGEDGIPLVAAYAASVLLIPENDVFEEGDYYIAVAPGTLGNGLRIVETRQTDDKLYIAEHTGTLSLPRSEVTDSGALDFASTETSVLTLSFVDNISSPTKFVNPFVLPDNATVPAFSGSGYSSPVENPEAFFLDKNVSSRWQYRFYSNMGITANTTQGLRFGRDEGDFMELPAINGQKLAAVSYVTGNASYQGYPGLCDASGSIVNGGDAFQRKLPEGKYIIWTNLDAETGGRYSLRCLGTANQITMRQLKLYYTGTAEATPGNAKTQPAAVMLTTVTFSGATNRNNTSLGGWDMYRGGFEYKNAGADWKNATDIDLGPLSAANFSHTLQIPDGEYEYRAWVSSGNVKVLGNPILFRTTSTIVSIDPEYTFQEFSSSFPTYYDNTIYPLNGSWNKNMLGLRLPIIELTGNHNTLYAYVDGGVGVRYLSNGYSIGGNATNPISKAYFELPALNGLSLTEVTATLGNDSTVGGWAVVDNGLVNATTSDVEGGDPTTVAKGKSPGTFTLRGTMAGKAYKLWFTGTGSAQLKGLTLKYSGTELPTVQYICRPLVSGSSLSCKIYVNAVCKDTDLSGGFQYKAGGNGNWTVLGTPALSALSAGTATLSTAAAAGSGDVVRAWIHDGTRTLYSEEIKLP